MALAAPSNYAGARTPLATNPDDTESIFFDSAEEALPVPPKQREQWLGWLEAKEEFESRDEDSIDMGFVAEANAPPKPATAEQAGEWLGWLATKREAESSEDTRAVADVGRKPKKPTQPRKPTQRTGRPRPAPGRRGPPSEANRRPSGRKRAPTGRKRASSGRNPASSGRNPASSGRNPASSGRMSRRPPTSPAGPPTRRRRRNAKQILGNVPGNAMAEILAKGAALRRASPEISRGRLGKHMLEELLTRAQQLQAGMRAGGSLDLRAMGEFKSALRGMFASSGSDESGAFALGMESGVFNTSLDDIELMLLDIFDQLQTTTTRAETLAFWKAQAEIPAPRPESVPDACLDGLELSAPILETPSPEPTFPEPTYPQPTYPQPAYPPYPQAGYPQPGYPQPGYPQPDYPQPDCPQPDYPQRGYPYQQVPHQHYRQPPQEAPSTSISSKMAAFSFDSSEQLPPPESAAQHYSPSGVTQPPAQTPPTPAVYPHAPVKDPFAALDPFAPTPQFAPPEQPYVPPGYGAVQPGWPPPYQPPAFANMDPFGPPSGVPGAPGAWGSSMPADPFAAPPQPAANPFLSPPQQRSPPPPPAQAPRPNAPPVYRPSDLGDSNEFNPFGTSWNMNKD